MRGRPCSSSLVAVLIAVALVFLADRLWLDHGNRGFSGVANEFCAFGGVKEMNPQQGFIICWDGTAR
jgi:hypothetical protein